MLRFVLPPAELRTFRWALAAPILCIAVARPVAAQVGAPTLQPQQALQTAPQTGVQSASPEAFKPQLIPLPRVHLSAGQLRLVELEGQFSQATVDGGGAAFASWFADDGVTLQNGAAPVQGRAAIAAHATWKPADYRLSWYAEGAQMDPGGESGFTWGHYDATTQPNSAHPITTSGRYITVWKRVAGKWRVALEASALDAPVSAMP